MTGAAGRPWAVDEVWLPVEQASDAGSVRRAATELGERLGLREHRRAELALVATELATNLLKHAVQGTLLVRALRSERGTGVCLVAVDAGPGVSDLAAAAVDGTSSAGTLGLGLGAIARLSDSCAVHSVPGRGTVVVVEVWGGSAAADGASAGRAHGRADGLTRPMTGEEVCGDAVAVRHLADGELLLGVDGLGHGPQAARAAVEAVRLFHASSAEAPADVLAELHAGLRGTRGAAAAVARVQREQRRVLFAGLGNVAGWVVGPAGGDDAGHGGHRRSMLSQPGIVGHQGRALREWVHDLPDDAAVVVHSDGVRTQWSLDDYPGVLRHGPLVLAATLLRDAGVRRDDASVLVDAPPGVLDPSGGRA